MDVDDAAAAVAESGCDSLVDVEVFGRRSI
jgi:hypothetical protein